MTTKLNVPYAEKDHAKSLGARWDADGKTWYAPVGADLSAFAAWIPGPSGVAKPGKQLFVDLVPSSGWFQNLRSELTEEEWSACKKFAYRRANYCCEICNGKGDKWPVECHERWAFDDAKGVQILMGLEALCPACHEATHMGFANINGRADAATQHLMRVNNWTETQAGDHIGAAFALWEERSRRQWDLDMTYLTTIGIHLSPETWAKLTLKSTKRTAKLPANVDINAYNS